MISASPGLTAFTFPSPSTVTIPSFDDDHSTLCSTAVFGETVAVRLLLPPAMRVMLD